MAKEVKTQSDKSQRRISLGLILTCVFGGIILFVAGGICNSLMNAKEHQRRLNDGGAVKSFLCAIESYAVDHDGWCPPDLATLAEESELPASRVYVCQGSATQVPKSAEDIRNGKCDFYYFGHGKRWSTGGSAIEPIIATKPSIRQGTFINVGYNNGSVHALLLVPHMIKELIDQCETNGKRTGKENSNDAGTDRKDREQNSPAEAGQ